MFLVKALTAKSDALFMGPEGKGKALAQIKINSARNETRYSVEYSDQMCSSPL